MEPKPRAFIQWKGTDACVDINCVCGQVSHFDGYSMYYVRCPGCQRVYEAPGFVPLIERGRFGPGEATDEEWGVVNAYEA